MNKFRYFDLSGQAQIVQKGCIKKRKERIVCNYSGRRGIKRILIPTVSLFKKLLKDRQDHEGFSP